MRIVHGIDFHYRFPGDLFYYIKIFFFRYPYIHGFSSYCKTVISLIGITFLKMQYLNINIFCYTYRFKPGLFKIITIFLRGVEPGVFAKRVKDPSYRDRKSWITDIKGFSGFQHSHRLIPELLLIRKVMICHAGYHNIHGFISIRSL